MSLKINNLLLQTMETNSRLIVNEFSNEISKNNIPLGVPESRKYDTTKNSIWWKINDVSLLISNIMLYNVDHYSIYENTAYNKSLHVIIQDENEKIFYQRYIYFVHENINNYQILQNYNNSVDNQGIRNDISYYLVFKFEDNIPNSNIKPSLISLNY